MRGFFLSQKSIQVIINNKSNIMNEFQSNHLAIRTANTNVVRIVALQVVVIALLYLYTKQAVFIYLLLVDFFIRGVLRSPNTLFVIIASKIEKSILKSGKSIDRSPKLFAAFIGFLFALSITISYALNWLIVSYVLSGILVFFALLEGVFEYCVACRFYSLYQRYKNW